MDIRARNARNGFGQAEMMFTRMLCAGLLWFVAFGVHASPIFKCVDVHGAIAFQDTSCAAHSRQAKLDVAGQPLIDADAPAPSRITRSGKSHAARAHDHASHRSATRTRKAKTVMSWECRAADGEVFYRHSRCPGSVPGDGIVRSENEETVSSRGPRRRHNAWGAVHVTGRKVSREEACRRIHATAAVDRDGHVRDEDVSVYEHLVGRDPCSGY